MIDESRRTVWGISVGSKNWSACELPLVKVIHGKRVIAESTSSPASVLLGYAPGESMRLDCWMHRTHANSIGLASRSNCNLRLGEAVDFHWQQPGWRAKGLLWPWKINGDLRQLES